MFRYRLCGTVRYRLCGTVGYRHCGTGIKYHPLDKQHSPLNNFHTFLEHLQQHCPCISLECKQIILP